MDPVTNAVVHSVASESARVLKKESDGFLKAVLGEPAKALGGLIADKINKRRHANLIKICVEAKRALADAGVLPKEVPLMSSIQPSKLHHLQKNPTCRVCGQTFWRTPPTRVRPTQWPHPSHIFLENLVYAR